MSDADKYRGLHGLSYTPDSRTSLTPETALDAGWSQEATARATARMFARRGGVAHARRLLGVMQEELMQIEREGSRE
jgi:hypothetical protein